jgi:hypothetical protein
MGARCTQFGVSEGKMEHERFLNTSISLIKTTLKGKISSEGRPG